MLKRFILAAAATIIFTVSAQASHCPLDMAKIDAILPVKMSSLPASDVAKIKSLRATGQAQHKAGDHKASEATLAQAMQMLGIK